MFTRAYIDTSEFPHKVKMNTLKGGDWIATLAIQKLVKVAKY